MKHALFVFPNSLPSIPLYDHSSCLLSLYIITEKYASHALS